MLISSAFLTPGLSTFSQGLLAVPRDRHLGGLPWPHRKFSAPASSLEGGWDQENSFSEEAWGPQRAEARLGYSQGAGKQPRCGWRAHITGRELENDLGVVGGHTSQAGSWKTTSVWLAGTHHRQASSRLAISLEQVHKSDPG